MADSDTIKEAKEKMQSLIDTQKKVDDALNAMAEGPEKERLKKLRADNRGFFSEYILPAWKKMQNLLSEETEVPKAGESSWYNPTTWFSGDNDSNMGFLPLIPIAAVLAATALVGYVAKSIIVEQQILSDPSLTASQKTKLLSTGMFDSLASTIGQAKWVALAALVGFGLYLGAPAIKAMSLKKNPRRRTRLSKGNRSRLK